MYGISREQAYKAFGEGRIGYIKAMRVTNHESYAEFLRDFFAAGFEYPRPTMQERQLGIEVFNAFVKEVAMEQSQVSNSMGGDKNEKRS